MVMSLDVVGRTERLDELAHGIRERGGRVVTCSTDVTRREDVERPSAGPSKSSAASTCS